MANLGITIRQPINLKITKVESSAAGVPTGGTTGQYLRKSSGTNYDTGWDTLDKADVGLDNVDNTSDVGKPVSTATQAALNAKANASHTHAVSDTSGLQTALDSKAESDDVILEPNVSSTPRQDFVSNVTFFESGHGWTSGTGSTIADDTSVFVTGNQSLRLTTDSSTSTRYAQKTFSSPTNITDKIIRVRVRFDDATNVGSLSVLMFTTVSSDYYQWTISGGYTASSVVHTGEWVTFTLNMADATVVGSPSPSNINAMRIRCSGNGTPLQMWMDEVSLLDKDPRYPNGVVSLTFDDGRPGVWTYARPKLDSYGYRGSCYIIEEDIDSGSSYMTSANLHNLYQSGWDMSGHSYYAATHADSFIGTYAADPNGVNEDLRLMRIAQNQRGFNRGTAHLASPKGETTGPILESVRKYYASCRSVSSRTLETPIPGDPYRLRAISSIGGVGGPTAAEITDRIQDAYDHGAWIILVFHNIVAGSATSSSEISQADFNTIIDYIHTLDIPVATVNDVLASDPTTETSKQVTRRLNGKADTGHTHAQSDITGLAGDLAMKAPLASPSLTGTPTAPTASAGTNTTQVATTAYVTAAITSSAVPNLDVVRTRPVWSTDFFDNVSAGAAPFVGTAIASGTIGAPTSSYVTSNHPGVLRMSSSTTTNSGYVYATDTAVLLLGGGEVYEAILAPVTLADTTIRAGFIDSLTSADNADGAYIEIPASGALVGKTASNSTRSTTGTSYTVTTATWYRVRISLNSTATAATFTLYSDAGTQLWTETLSTNIPTASGRLTGAGVIATNVGTTAVDLMHVDYMAVQFGQSTALGR